MNDHEILAKTIYGEARGEYNLLNGGLSSLIAIGNVVINRLKQNMWFGSTISEVCLKPKQFSCWNHNDPNRPLLDLPLTHQKLIQDPIFNKCLEVAKNINVLPDLTKGSDHYHHQNINPYWCAQKKPMVHIGHHVFYK